MIELTQEEQVAQSYKAALDSVDLLNLGQPEGMSDEEWQNCKQRNIDHLQIQLEKPEFYEGYDLAPLWAAVGQK